jgi:hypothetical protein
MGKLDSGITHKIGEPFTDKPNEFELVLSDHIIDVSPHSYKIADKIDIINPKDYFITSGDAVLKGIKLEQELWKLAGQIKKEFAKKKTKKHAEYVKILWKAAGQARTLVVKLKEAKGEDTFLETEWRSHSLFCIPKNPRKK